MQRTPHAPLLAALLLAGCVAVPAEHEHDHGHEVVVAPALPVIVEFDAEPYYYYHHGF